MVFVPFRGGWLVLPGKGTLVHNQPDTKAVYSYDGLGRRVAKTCLNTDTDEIASRQTFTYVGHDLVAEHTTTGDTGTAVGAGSWYR